MVTQYVYVATCDILANGTTGGTKKYLGAFNLVSVGTNPSDGAGESTPDMLFPWGQNPAGGTPRPIEDFLLVSFPKPAGRSAQVSTAGKPVLKALNPLAIDAKFAALLEKQFAAGVNVILPFDDPSASVEAGDHTWSATIAGASQQGYPIAHSLGLSFFVGEDGKWTDIGGDWAIIIPKTFFGLSIKDDNIFVSAGLPGLTTVQAAVVYQLADGRKSIRLRIDAFTLDSTSPDFRGAALEQTFVGYSQQIHAATFTNWTGLLPQNIGEFLDWAWILRFAEWPTTFGPQKLTAREIFRDASKARKAEIAFSALSLSPPFPPVGLAGLLATETTAVVAEMPLRTYIVEPLLLFFHDHADLGLRRPINARKPATTAGAPTDPEISESLAFDLLGYVARSAQGAPPDVDRRLSDALTKVAKLDGSILYPEVSAPTPVSASLTKWTREILLPVVQEIDGSDDGKSHSGLYENLRQMLEFEVGIRPLWGTEQGADLNQNNADLEAIKLTKSNLAKAGAELSRLSEDENALLLLFCRQWDSLLNRLRGGNPDHIALYKDFQHILSFEDDGTGAARSIVNGKNREVIRDRLQETHVRLSQRYSYGLAGTLLSNGTKNSTTFFDELQPLANAASGDGWLTHYLAKALATDISRDEAEKAKKKEANDASIDKDFAKLLRKIQKIIVGGNADGTWSEPLGKQARAAVRSQLFLAAAYLSKAMKVYLAQRSTFRPSALLPSTFVPTQQSAGAPQVPQNLDDLLLQNLTAESSDTIVGSDPQENFWKLHSWAAHLIGLDSFASYLPTPPPLPIPFSADAREYDPARYSGLLVLARRRKGNVQHFSWWLVNVGEPVVEDLAEPFLVASGGPFGAARQGNSGELVDVLEDEVDMSKLFGEGQDKLHGGNRFIRFNGSRAVPAPWQISESFGIAQNVLEFRGKPVAVRLWDDATDDRLANAEISEGDRGATPNSTLNVVRYQIIDATPAHKGWGPVPGLRYDKDWIYDFLFAPIHNTGALPLALSAGPGLPGELLPRTEGTGLPEDLTSADGLPIVTVTDYVRRVPVQQVRLARPSAILSKLAENIQKLKNSPADRKTLESTLERDLKSVVFQDFQTPPIPDGVRPLYADLQDKDTFQYLKSLAGDTAEKIEPPLMLPAQTILLHRQPKVPETTNGRLSPNSGKNLSAQQAREAEQQAKLATNKVQFTIRPPATTIENWTIWQSSLFDQASEPDATAIMDCIADMNRLVREHSGNTTSSLDQVSGLELPQLLDDPAVVGVIVFVRVILDLRESVNALPQAEFDPVFYPFIKQTLKTYPAMPDPALDGQHKLNDLVAQLCRSQVQTSSRPITVTLLDSADAEQVFSFSDDKVTVPDGCVVEIEAIPCINQDEHDKRFGIYKTADPQDPKAPFDLETYPNVVGAGNVYGVRPATYRIWVEAVPPVVDGETNSDGLVAPNYLPSSQQVWDALRLASVGTYSRENRQIPRLEIAVLPPDVFPKDHNAYSKTVERLRRWCFVSEVYAEIQPWVWRGLPEDRYESLTALIPQHTDSNSPDRDPKASPDMDPSVLKQLVEGEAAAFGEREDAAARVQRGLVNYAAPFKLWRDAVDSFLPPFIVYQDRGEQAETPHYYRVKLVVKSRYAGLGVGTAPDERQKLHATPVSSEYQWPWPGSPTATEPNLFQRKSSHRRILFRGQLRQKLDLPRIKMVLPVLESLEETRDHGIPDKKSSEGTSSKATPPTRPGFLVLTREPLRSPWHRLIAEVDWACVHIGRSAQDVVEELPEFGPDPITADSGFDWAFRPKSSLNAQSQLDGRAFGLTYEREADAAFFPNAGFYFDPPFQAPASAGDLGPAGNDLTHDWFAKVHFRWEIRPARVMDNLSSALVGESTQPWQVRFLAPIQWINFEGKSAADLTTVAFRMTANGPEFFDTVTGASLRSPKAPEYPQNPRHPGASPAAMLLFVTWSLVPDFLNPERSKVPHSIFAFKRNRPVRIYHNAVLDRTQAEGRETDQSLLADGGNFLLLFGRSGDLQQYFVDLDSSQKSKDGLDLLVSDYLFRMGADDDALAMITRCSPPIYRQ